MREAKKFSFETVFASDVEIAGKKPPVYSEDDLILEKDRSYERGRRDGWQNAMDGVERQCIDRLKSEFEILIRVQKEIEETAYRQVAEMAARILRKLLPHFIDQGAFAEIEAVVREAFESTEEKKLEIIVSESLKDRMERLISEITSGAPEDYKAVVSGDRDLSDRDVLIRWEGGGLERRLERIEEEIEQALQRLGAAKILLETEPSPEEKKSSSVESDKEKKDNE